MFRDYAEFLKSRIEILIDSKQEHIIAGKVQSFEDYKRCIGYIQGVKDAIKTIEESCKKYYKSDKEETIVIEE